MPRPKSNNALTSAERTARHLQGVAARGGRQLSPIKLGPDDAGKLADIKVARGIIHDAEIIRVLIREASD